ncbi:MAG: hypothetical protein L6V85_10330 [Clostridiales bacterium]|nr:MAG: hypothetical protein L6V85_10330 [Clostridiales bacterium]
MDNFYTPLDNKVIKSNARDFIRGRLWMFWSVLLVVGIIESLANSLPQWIFRRQIVKSFRHNRRQSRQYPQRRYRQAFSAGITF